MNTEPAIHCLHDALVSIRDLREHPRNPNRHTQKQSDLLARIITTTGWRNPITVSRRSGFIVSGHGRLYAARTMRWAQVPIQYQDFSSDEEELQHLLADNRLAEFSQRDDAALASILRELHSEGEDLSLTGYDEAHMQKLLDRLGAPPDDAAATDQEIAASAELAAKWGTALGQVWQLGPHRLAVSDSRHPETWSRLMAGEKAVLIFTDPPYGVEYEDAKGRAIEGDDLRGDSLADFLGSIFRLAMQHSIPESPWYIWHASETRDDFSFAMKNCGLVEKQYLTWIKESFVLGRADYHWQTEHAFYAVREGHQPRFFGDRTQSTLWKITAVPGAVTGAVVGSEGVLITDGHGRSLLIKETGPKAGKKLRHFRVPDGDALTLLPMEATTAWQVTRDDTSSYIHPNQKPIGLAGKALVNSSQPGDLVVDMFAGSGSTIMACEHHGRIARCLEKDPQYAAAILERWLLATGKPPQLAFS